MCKKRGPPENNGKFFITHTQPTTVIILQHTTSERRTSHCYKRKYGQKFLERWLLLRENIEAVEIKKYYYKAVHTFLCQ